MNFRITTKRPEQAPGREAGAISGHLFPRVPRIGNQRSGFFQALEQCARAIYWPAAMVLCCVICVIATLAWPIIGQCDLPDVIFLLIAAPGFIAILTRAKQ